MFNKKTLALLIGGWALMTIYGKSRQPARQADKVNRKEQVQRWESEGGNLHPQAMDPSTTIVPGTTTH